MRDKDEAHTLQVALYSLVRAWVQELAETVPPEKGFYPHSLSVEKWAVRLYEERHDEASPVFLRIAALLHDIDRAHPNREIRGYNFPDYESYKKRHSIESAEIAKAFLIQHGASEDFVSAVVHVIVNHEYGGDKYSDVVVDADSISFFEDNLELYLKVREVEEATNKIRFMYSRMSPHGQAIVRGIDFGEHQQLFNCAVYSAV
jgi:putative nucleotidyltransferase with HDIG domain